MMAGRYNVNDYVPVQDRINRFWTEHPNGQIETKLMSLPDDFAQCRYVAAVYKERGYDRPDATGWAFEVATQGTRGPNDTNHEENCETSAIGRALANMGYATSLKDRPSREEMRKTAFAADLDEGERIVDAPVEARTAAQAARPADAGPRPASPAERPHNGPQADPFAGEGTVPGGASKKSVRLMMALTREAQVSEVMLKDYIATFCDGKRSRLELTQADAGRVIDWLKQRTGELKQGGQPPLVDAPAAAAVREPAHFATR